MSDRPACDSCVFWQPPRQSAERSYGFPSDAETKTGQCRRFPPVAVLTERGLRSNWPLTFSQHWCGEHAVREHP